MKRGTTLAYGVAALAILAAVLAAVGGQLPAGTRGASYLISHGALAVAMLLAWRVRWPRPMHRTWLVVGMLCRLLLIPASSYTTHDVDRYLWDGRVLLEGLDPYRMSPSAPEVTHLRATWPTPEEHVEYPTLYPPGALALFGACAAFGPTLGPWLYRLAAAGASLLLLLIMAGWLRERDRERALPLVALHPLVIFEAGIGAHVDIFAALALVVGLRALAGGPSWAAGGALGIAPLIKQLPGLALVPVLAAGQRPYRRAGIIAIACVAGAHGAFLLVGLRPIGSLPVFLAGWRFGSPVVAALEAVSGWNLWIPLTGIGAIAAVTVGVWAGRAQELWVATAMTLATALVLSPVVFPWYLLPLVALLPLVPSRLVLAWSLALPLTYEVTDRFDLTGDWSPAAWPLWVVVGAWAVGLGLDRRRAVESCGRSRASS